MSPTTEHLGLLITFILAITIATLILLLNQLLGPKNKSSAIKREPFECGFNQFEEPKGHFSIKFYLFAMLFILFDVEIVWFFPWAVILRELQLPGLITMFSFMTILILGYIYAWKKRALEWEE